MLANVLVISQEFPYHVDRNFRVDMIFTKARAESAAKYNVRRQNYGEIDKGTGRRAKKAIPKEDKKWLRRTQNTAHWKAEEVKERIDETHENLWKSV